jgi:hypothetical protein
MSRQTTSEWYQDRVEEYRTARADWLALEAETVAAGEEFREWLEQERIRNDERVAEARAEVTAIERDLQAQLAASAAFEMAHRAELLRLQRTEREAWHRQVEAAVVLTDFEHTRLQDELNKEDGP